MANSQSGGLSEDHKNPQYDQDKDGVIDNADKVDGNEASSLITTIDGSSITENENGDLQVSDSIFIDKDSQETFYRGMELTSEEVIFQGKTDGVIVKQLSVYGGVDVEITFTDGSKLEKTWIVFNDDDLTNVKINEFNLMRDVEKIEVTYLNAGSYGYRVVTNE